MEWGIKGVKDKYLINLNSRNLLWKDMLYKFYINSTNKFK